MEIPSYIHEIKSINLTDAGKIRLSPFSSDVIKIADKQTMTTNKSLTNPFGYFVSICNNTSRERGLTPDWSLVTSLSMTMNVSPDDPLLLNTDVNRETIKGKDKTKRPAAWAPVSDDPYYRSPRQRELFEAQRTKRELEWSRMESEEPERLRRIQAAAKKMRQDIGLNEQGEKVAEPVTTFFGIVPQEKESRGAVGPTEADTPYVNEDGVWEEI